MFCFEIVLNRKWFSVFIRVSIQYFCCVMFWTCNLLEFIMACFEIDRVVAVDILHDIGRSINPGIDIGQVEGGFIQGMGWLTCEEVVWNAKGRLLSHAPSTYKIPASGDVPAHFKVEFWPEPNREENVYGSKATGETPLMLAISVFQAIRHAIGCVAAPGVAQIPMQAPATPETILRTLAAVQSN
jgi:xanthine dehydrogenase large subunit